MSMANSWMRSIGRGAAGSRKTGALGPFDARCWRIFRQVWKEPDEGIWEVRGVPKQFTYSKIKAWVAFDGPSSQQ